MDLYLTVWILNLLDEHENWNLKASACETVVCNQAAVHITSNPAFHEST